MLDWIFEGIAKWVASIMTQLMDAVSGLFLEALGTDMTAMEEYFPFMTSAYTIIQYTAWAILFLSVVWQLFRAFGGPLTEAENPWHLLVRGSLSAFLIAYSKSIFTIALDIARVPYTALMDASMNPGDFTFAGIEQALTNGLVTIVSIATIVGLLLLIIMMIALAWNYFKLLLETVERYVLVGVLCYTSPLAYSMAASKSTSRIFQSWCRMVGSQLLLLVLNVWFLRAFNSAVGQLAANGGALTNGQGSIFLWLFCALALLKIAQKCDSYLASLGLSVAQTGSSMGMEMLMAARAITGFSKGGNQNAASTFSGAGKTAAGTAGAASGTGGGLLSGFVSRYKPNSFVRDAVVDGGSRMGAGGSVGFVGRAFGGIAARNGAALTADSISSVANRPSKVSGTIAGEIADRSLSGYMPQLANGPAGKMSYSNTQITGGHISTTATSANGRQANVEMFSAAQYDRPETPYTTVNAADGSQWYQVASGEEMGTFYSTPAFTGDQSEAAQVAEAFPSAPDGTLLRQVDDGTLEANYPDGSNALWYSSAHYQEPDAPHETIQGANGLEWYAMEPHAATPQFDTGNETEFAAQPVPNAGGDIIDPPPVSNGDIPLTPPDSNIADGMVITPSDNTNSDGEDVFADAPIGGIANQEPPAADSSGTANGSTTSENMDINVGTTPNSPPAGSSIGEMPVSAPSNTAGEVSDSPSADNVASGLSGSASSSATKEEVPIQPSGSNMTWEIPIAPPSGSIAGEIPIPPSSSNVTGEVPGPDLNSTSTEKIPASPPSGNATVEIPPLPSGGMVGEAPVLPPTDSPTWEIPASPPSYGSNDDVPGYTPSGGSDPVPEAPVSSPSSPNQPSNTPPAGNIAAYNQALFGQFMPGFDQPVVSIDNSRAGDGILEVRHADGSGTAFYDRTMYQQPRGDHHVFEDSSGGQWYAISGTPAVERRPVYQDGKPVYDGDELKTVNVETVRYKAVPSRFKEPVRRPAQQRKAPKKKN